ncbi:MAG: hypothetical protein JW751_29830 [Polyangiaceae bacterium]|nr:hypothetical protein [Polyangiaceae bacterium]
MKAIAVVSGVGACTSVAFTAKQTGFLLRAGAAGMMEAALVDENEEPITACFLTTLDPLLVGAQRASVLGVDTLRAALVAMGDMASSLRLKILLCVDESLARPKSGAMGAQDVLASLVRTARETSQQVDGEICVRGAAGPGMVLPDALGKLDNTHDAIALCGVHTDYDPARIADLEARGRLFSADNLDALIPGEAAACVVLTSPDLARRHGIRAHAQLHSIGTGYEKATPDNDESAYEASGLTVAVRQAGAPLLAEKLQAGWILTDLTFERCRVYEWQSVSVRARKMLGEPHHLDSPAQRLGHLGAAVMPLHLALAAEAWRHGYAPSPIALSLAGSDTGERAAVVLSAP